MKKSFSDVKLLRYYFECIIAHFSYFCKVTFTHFLLSELCRSDLEDLKLHIDDILCYQDLIGDDDDLPF